MASKEVITAGKEETMDHTGLLVAIFATLIPTCGWLISMRAANDPERETEHNQWLAGFNKTYTERGIGEFKASR